MEEKENKLETIIEELEIDTTIHGELIHEILEVHKKFVKETDDVTARYLTIAYMVRRLSVGDLPLNKERKSKLLEVK